jgi:hypothetical protein
MTFGDLCDRPAKIVPQRVLIRVDLKHSIPTGSDEEMSRREQPDAPSQIVRTVSRARLADQACDRETSRHPSPLGDVRLNHAENPLPERLCEGIEARDVLPGGQRQPDGAPKLDPFAPRAVGAQWFLKPSEIVGLKPACKAGGGFELPRLVGIGSEEKFGADLGTNGREIAVVELVTEADFQLERPMAPRLQGRDRGLRVFRIDTAGINSDSWVFAPKKAPERLPSSARRGPTTLCQGRR